MDDIFFELHQAENSLDKIIYDEPEDSLIPEFDLTDSYLENHLHLKDF
ncbi:hypothetical protein [Nostoc sp.]